MKQLMRVGIALVAALSIVASSGGAAAARTYQDTSTKIVYGGTWLLWGSGLCSKGTCHFDTDASNTITITFTGPYLDIGYVARLNSGIVTVTVDGASTTLDSWSGATTAAGDTAQVLTFALATGTHTVVIAATGTQNPGSIGSVFYFDDVQVRHIP